MSREKRTPALLFNTIAALFSAVLLVMSLLCAVETAAVNDRAAALKKENERLRRFVESIPPEVRRILREQQHQQQPKDHDL